MASESLAIGIDLGTTNSCVAVFRNGKVEVIKNEFGKKITPSMVSFTDSQRFIGDGAKDLEITNSENTVYGIKRLIGREFNDPAIQDDIRRWPFTVINEKGKPAVKVKYMGRDKTFEPEEISAMVLEKMKSIAETYLGQTVKDAVITVPAYFDNNQRQATKAAGEIAGLNVLRLMNEPTAAAVAYGLDKKGGNRRNVLVYDLGGGTFDISVLSMEAGTFKVKAIKGDTHLGGEDFDNRLVDHYAKEIKTKFKKDIFTDKRALRRLSTKCEKTKLMLTNSTQAVFDIPNLIGDNDFESSVTRRKFEELNQDLFDSTIDTVSNALQDSGFAKSQINDVVLVGGSTRIPKVQDMLLLYFEKQRLNKGINPDEAVAYGAAIQAAILARDPSKKLQNLLLYDVIPLSLGIQIIGGIMSPIISRNCSIPVVQSRNYTTTVDNQTKMSIDVYEGERSLTKDNNLLGNMILDGIPPEPRGYASVDVVFEIDENCILQVKARDRDTGRENNIQIINNNKKLSREQLDNLIQQAELYRQADLQNSMRIDAMNELGFYVHDIKSALNKEDLEMSIPPRQKENVLAKVNAVGVWLDTAEGKSSSASVYEHKKMELENIWNPIVTLGMEANRRNVTGNRPVIQLGD